MATYNGLLLSTVEELHFTQQEANMFTEPHYCGRRYSRNVIYTIDNFQMALFEQIIHFENARTLREKQRDLIMFIENNEQYKDINYKLVFCHLAHDFCIRHYRQINIPHVDFRNNTFRNQPRINFAFTQEAVPQQQQLQTQLPHQIAELQRAHAHQQQLQHQADEELRLELQNMRQQQRQELEEIRLELQAQIQRDDALIQRLRSQYQIPQQLQLQYQAQEEPTSPISRLNNEFRNLRIH